MVAEKNVCRTMIVSSIQRGGMRGMEQQSSCPQRARRRVLREVVLGEVALREAVRYLTLSEVGAVVVRGRHEVVDEERS